MGWPLLLFLNYINFHNHMHKCDLNTTMAISLFVNSFKMRSTTYTFGNTLFYI